MPKGFKSLLDIPFEIKKEIYLVDIFRPAEDDTLTVAQAVKLKEMHGKPYVVSCN